MWPEPVERVARELRAAAIEATVQEFAEEISTAEAAATAIGCPLDEIVTAALFVCDGRPVVALIPGDRAADEKRVATAANATEIRPATAAEVREVTGFDSGAVAPFPLPPSLSVLMERTLFQHARVWVRAGSETHMAGLATAELQQLSGAETADLLGPRYSSATDR
ncbi:MAG TPA: YbaK/EbsC family protein [Gaiellaceae bacterium]|jgi:prolyl-tRNA editing enzyme YbaK/EbsC (Cys-tRNA(Pro) deacylase)|nr:YbaK/EbsC family protein [Gaiellaceae bacterium]